MASLLQYSPPDFFWTVAPFSGRLGDDWGIWDVSGTSGSVPWQLVVIVSLWPCPEMSLWLRQVLLKIQIKGANGELGLEHTASSMCNRLGVLGSHFVYWVWLCHHGVKTSEKCNVWLIGSVWCDTLLLYYVCHYTVWLTFDCMLKMHIVYKKYQQFTTFAPHYHSISIILQLLFS